MTEKERRREKRHVCSQPAGVYLSSGPEGPPVSPVIDGQLITLSRWGACVALNEVMTGSIHLAYGPMESASLQLNIVLEQITGEPLIVPARPIWLDKIPGEDIPPFRIGVEFIVPLTERQLQLVNQQDS